MYKDSYRYRKKYYVTLFTSIYVVIFAICAVVIAANWKYVKILFTPREQQVSVEQHQFNELFNKIQHLEKLSKDFNEENYQLRAIAYIRSAQYNGDVWDTFDFGTLAGFDEYVLAHQGDTRVTSLKTMGSTYKFIVPKTKKSVDFYHMFAVLNAMYLPDCSVQDAFSWAGDLVQIAASYNGTSLIEEELLNDVRTKMNSTSAFGEADRNADIDAINIYNLMVSNKLTFKSVYASSIMYYATVTQESQLQSFEEYLGIDYCGQSESVEILYERLRNNMYVQLLADEYGLDFPDSGENEEDLTTEVEIEGEMVTISTAAGIYRACVTAFIETLRA